MQKFATDKLAVYVVWEPVLASQDSAALQKNSARLRDLLPPGPRVTHYIDPKALSGTKYGAILGVPGGEPAWDVYMAFAAGVRWGDAPPAPAHIEHQMYELEPKDLLNGPRFAEEVRKLLAKIGQ